MAGTPNRIEIFHVLCYHFMHIFPKCKHKYLDVRPLEYRILLGDKSVEDDIQEYFYFKEKKLDVKIGCLTSVQSHFLIKLVMFLQAAQSST